MGNLHTAGLVSRHGSIDWACLPRFASPSVFARLLDLRRGGYHRLAPTEPYRSSQRYRPSSCLLETTFDLSRGRRLVLTDLMPVVENGRPEGASVFLREARASGGSVPVRFEFAPRFDFGRATTALLPADGGLVASGAGELLSCTFPTNAVRLGRTGVAETLLPAGGSVRVELRWGEGSGGSFDSLRADTERFWRSWAHSSDVPVHKLAGRWHRWVERSELTLKLLSHADTGAFVAAPTTSLPEWPGGRRNWDYRYVWIRDAAFAAQAMLQLGHGREARSFLRWALMRMRGEPAHHLRVVYGAHGETDLAERTLRSFAGLWGSRPVRIGNGAARQFQLDVYGELLDAALLLEEVDPEFLAEHWVEIAQLAEAVVDLWRLPDRGIWEIRAPPRQYVHSKLMAWVALDRASRLADGADHTASARRWASEAERIRTWITTHGYDPDRASFRQAAGSPETDAANLRIPLVGFLPHTDPRVAGTLERVLRDLARGPFVYRYRGDDGVGGREGAFLAASFWLVECLARSGRRAEALRAWSGLLDVGAPLGLFPEEFDPVRRLRLGNFPQALSHIGVLRAAIALGESTPGRIARTALSRAGGRRRTARPREHRSASGHGSRVVSGRPRGER